MRNQIKKPKPTLLIKKVVTTYVGPKDVIKKRYAWMAYEMYEMLLQMATGVVK